MKQVVFAGLALGLAGCIVVDVDEADTTPVVREVVRVVEAPPPETAKEALRPYYSTIPNSDLPTAPAMAQLDKSQPLQKILVGSCHDEEMHNPAMETMATEAADLFLFLGDNVYGDIDGRVYQNYDLNLTELRNAYADLAAAPEFQALSSTVPMMVTWDDHDYGVNDGGADFPAKEFAERIFETFWGFTDAEKASRPGVYYSKMIGPEGQKTQILMLDTRFFRSDLTRTPMEEWGSWGMERYVPSEHPDQQLLGEAQWAWLEAELQKPADLRLIVSSIQITPDVHGWEAWDKMPLERQRLYDLLTQTGAQNVVFVSGDRHTSFLYRDDENGAYPYYEITASSLNKPFARDPVSNEVDATQLGTGYAFANYGEIVIDWEARFITFNIKTEAGEVVLTETFSIDSLQAG